MKVPDKWCEIGHYLHLPLATMKVIDIDNNTVAAKIEAMISGWLYSGKATWDNLINALVKTGVILSCDEDLPQPQLHGMPQQPSHPNVWEIKINDLHKAHKTYRLRKFVVQKKLNTSILHIRFILGVPIDISDEVLMGTIEGYMTVNTFFVSWHHNITNIVETHHYNRKLLEKLTNLLQNSSIEACRHLGTILNINASQKNLLHKKEAGISLEYSEGPESEINEK